MIPLNKPFRKKLQNSGKYSFAEEKDLLNSEFRSYNFDWLYSVRNGLNRIYSHLFKQRGSLNVGVSPLTCIEALFPIIYNSHNLVFIDIDPETFNLNEQLLFNHNNLDVLQVIHLGGNPQKMDIISSWAKANNVIVVEDCAQALGARYDGKSVGTYGDYTVFSLIKNLHTPIGAILLAKELIKLQESKPLPLKLRFYKLFKHQLESNCSFSPSINNLLYKRLLQLKESEKSNYGLTSYRLNNNDICFLKKRLQFLASLVARRIEITKKIVTCIDNGGFLLQKTPIRGLSNRNRLLLRSTKEPASSLIAKLRRKGIAANNLTQSYIISEQPRLDKIANFNQYLEKATLPQYFSIHDNIISIPNSPAMSDKEIFYIIEEVNKIVK